MVNFRKNCDCVLYCGKNKTYVTITQKIFRKIDLQFAVHYAYDLFMKTLISQNFLQISHYRNS